MPGKSKSATRWKPNRRWVGGVIDAIYPWKDDAVALIINDAGKGHPAGTETAFCPNMKISCLALFLSAAMTASTFAA